MWPKSHMDTEQNGTEIERWVLSLEEIMALGYEKEYSIDTNAMI